MCLVMRFISHSADRALEWLSLELYLSGRQPAESGPAKPSPRSLSHSSSESSTAALNKSYVRWAPWLFPDAYDASWFCQGEANIAKEATIASRCHERHALPSSLVSEDDMNVGSSDSVVHDLCM